MLWGRVKVSNPARNQTPVLPVSFFFYRHGLLLETERCGWAISLKRPLVGSSQKVFCLDGILEVSGSYLGRDASYRYRSLSWFLSVPPGRRRPEATTVSM